MNKTTTLKSIRDARKAHEFQMQMIKTAIYDGEIDDLGIFSKLECKLGRWLYAENSYMRDILGSLFFDTIDSVHAKWHNEYTIIYEILIKKEEKKVFSQKYYKVLELVPWILIK